MEGVVAHVRPLDDEDLAVWFDLYPLKTGQDNQGALHLARKALAYGAAEKAAGKAATKVEGLMLGDVPFDTGNALHVKRLLGFNLDAPSGLIVGALLARAGITEAQAGKSDSLSDSSGAPSGSGLPVAAAPPNSETRTTAGSPTRGASRARHGTKST